ncbi:hypothetical protein [Nocardia africana]|uniref:Uncharacterized protein n=1 Tax=Nocardia africana TaxID=134964 RepID=A0A378WKP2_9NOCA|nr:hypothetical protein [Nocardia africana]SUA41021.1 Uncharacterised protein [Nocardia africana]
MLPRARPTTGSPPSRRAVRRPGIDALRGSLVGVAVVVLAVAAHGWADGGCPGSATLALLLLSAAATGTFASMLPPTGGVRAGPASWRPSPADRRCRISR